MTHSIKTVIKDEFPWYTKIHNLIGNCPNVKPVGIGNSKSSVDLSILSTGHQQASSKSDSNLVKELGDAAEVSCTGSLSMAVHGDITDAPQPHTSLLDDDKVMYAPSPVPLILDGDNHPDMANLSCKRKSSPDSGANQELADEPNTLVKAHSKKGSRTPVAATPTKTVSKGELSAKKTKDSKKLKYSEEFANIVLVEEHTKQKQLELKKLDKELELAKYKLKAKAQIKALHQKAALEKVCLDVTTQY